MFHPTKNKYRFKYLVTGLTGDGIPHVYLPSEPKDEEVLFKKENKFTRPIPSDQLQDWMDEYEIESSTNDQYVHQHQAELNEWEEREFERTQNGIWFWNNGVKTYLTGDHYKYLTQWQPLFGFPDYWEPDKEVFYWIKYWEEDPCAYGGAYNTGRRTGKSTKMGFWIMNRTSTNFKHLAGMQGEDNTKIKDFYEQMVIEPFYKLPYFSKPVYDTTTLQKKGIIFKEPPRKNKRVITSKKKLVLESRMDYRTSEANKYDQAKLHSSVVEEPGKTLACDINDRWGFMKPCHRLGKTIIGKSFWGTTCEFMDSADKGGKAYQKLIYNSDFDKKNALGQTVSGLYASMMPADCVFEGCIDDFGIPQREEARRIILEERKSVEDDPKAYSTLIRKYPLNWNEVFYISAEHCEFNAKILQDRRSEILAGTNWFSRYDMAWKDNIRFSKVIVNHNPVNGWFKSSWLPTDPEKEANLVGSKTINGEKVYFPKNEMKIISGIDPIDHGITVDSQVVGNEFLPARRSKPVMLIKRKYDSALDGPLSQESLEARAKEKYMYKSNRYFGMMDLRPNDPNVLFERALMICWFFGCALHVEQQKPGIIRYFHTHNCGGFIMNKYIPVEVKRQNPNDQGTPASAPTIQEYTASLSTYVEYFGHTIPFIEVVDDLLVFKPHKTKEHDYSVSMGFTELGEKIKPKNPPPPPILDLGEIFTTFDRYGNAIN